MPPSVKLSDITVITPESDIYTIPEEFFFKDREAGNLRPNTLPLPDGVKQWMRAKFMGEDIHFAQVNNTIYMLVDTTIFGYCLLKLVSQSDDDDTFKVAHQQGVRIITNRKEQMIMANSLHDIAQRYESTGMMGGMVNPVQNMNLGQAAPVMAPTAGEGISRTVDPRRLHSEIITRGYVAGYVMGNAPQLTMSVQRKKAKDGTVTADIVAKESKPSRCLAVLMALPANCVQRNGVLATPADISAGLVDAGGTNEMIYQSFSVNAAISYINAFGGKLPEYAPNVSDAREQWSAEDILSGKPEVSFVYVHASENTSRNSKSKDRFRFRLKTTSPRNSLYTEGNHVCLRALEHTSTKCTSDADAYRLNEIAFGKWRYQKPASSPENALQRAMNDCPSQIWKTKYVIDGVEKEGIGSAFFMSGSSVKSESGENIPQKPLTYFPWFQTGDRRQAVGARVDRIVLRVFRAADGTHKENMVTKPVYLKDEPNNQLFKGYKPFIEFITGSNGQGFLTLDKLYAMGSRATKSKTRTFGLSSEQRTSLESFMRNDDVAAEIQAVRDEAADRAVLRDAMAR